MKLYQYIYIFIIAALIGANISLYDFDVPDMLGAKKVKEWEKASSPLKLKTDKSKLLDVQETDDIRCADPMDISTCENKGKIKKYLYVSDKKLKKEKLTHEGKVYDEVRRTKNSITFKIDPPKTKGENLLGEYNEETKTYEQKEFLGASEAVDETREYFVSVFYSGDPFYQEPETGDWYQTETATTTIEAYNEQTATSTVDMIMSLIGVRSAVGACGDSGGICYSTANDSMLAYIPGSPVAWSTLRTTSPCTHNGNNSSETSFQKGSTNWSGNWQTYFPVDTSALPDAATISAASWFVNVKTLYTNQYIDLSIAKTGQANLTTIADYTQDYPATRWSSSYSNVNTNTMSVDSYAEFALNSSGISNISKTGISDFGLIARAILENSEPSGWTSSQKGGIAPYLSEQTGTDKDPYMSVTYSSGATEEPKKDDNFWFN